LIDFVREPSDALEDSLVLTELIGLLAPKLYELDRELFEVRLSLGGHVPFIGRAPGKHEDPPERVFML
jgi:hypothetical protein